MKDITVKPDITIRQAMKKLSEYGKKCLVIIDQTRTLLGTLSDGDLRKAILGGADMAESIHNVYQGNPIFLVSGKFRIEEAKKLFIKNMFDLIPIVDEQNKLINILHWETILNNGKKKQKEKLKKYLSPKMLKKI